MINVNATIVLQIIHFLVLLFILNKIMIKPIMRIINERSDHFEKEKKQMITLQEETQELTEKCVLIEKDARKKAWESNSQLKKEANDASEKIFNETREQVAEIREIAEKNIKDLIDKARLSLENEAATLAAELTEKVIGRRFAN